MPKEMPNARRDFIKKIPFLPFAFAAVVQNKEEAGKPNFRVSTEEYPSFLNIPVELQSYASKFHNWPALIENQKSMTINYISSEAYSKMLLKQHARYFPNKDNVWLLEKTSSLIADRLSILQNTETVFVPQPEGVGGKYLGNEVNQIQVYTVKQDSPLFEVNLFTSAHEFFHSTQSHQAPNKLFFIQTIQDFLDCLESAKAGALEKEKDYIKSIKAYKEALITSGETDGRASLLDTNSWNKYLAENVLPPHHYRPWEVPSILFEIKISLHCISKYDPLYQLDFDMNTQEVEEKHLDFLRKHPRLITGSVGALFESFDNEKMLFLLNNLI